MKNKITIDKERCKGCTICVSACPIKILAIDTEYLNSKGFYAAKNIDMEKCTACCACALMCPETCIEVERNL